MDGAALAAAAASKCSRGACAAARISNFVGSPLEIRRAPCRVAQSARGGRGTLRTGAAASRRPGRTSRRGRRAPSRARATASHDSVRGIGCAAQCVVGQRHLRVGLVRLGRPAQPQHALFSSQLAAAAEQQTRAQSRTARPAAGLCGLEEPRQRVLATCNRVAAGPPAAARRGTPTATSPCSAFLWVSLTKICSCG